MIGHELRPDEGLLIVTPEDPLSVDDFQSLAQEVDNYLQQNQKLRGLMIYTMSFPGWADFAALIAHLQFIKDHHRKIAKVAAVTDSDFLSIVPEIARHFTEAEIRHFPYSDQPAAAAWLMN